VSIRVAQPKHYLMCRPTYFDVTYAINPWMRPDKPVDTGAAIAQWETLRQIYLDLGHQVSLIEPIEGLPDMVFAANGALVVDGLVFGSRFRYDERAPEAYAYASWFEAHRDELGLTGIHRPAATTEGEGDLLVSASHVLAGTGFRTDPEAHAELAELVDRPIVTLQLVDPRFYHLDTALAVLDDETIAFLPDAFTPESAALLRTLFPNAIEADAEDASVLGLNAVSDGRHVVLPAQAVGLARRLAAAGFEPVLVDLSELRKAGGGPKCCTLELRGARA
jgi:N-dimethylarginine dimethylaminohydrolase